uniref:Flavonol 4'-sulfotransferase n=1 Tax=Tanacetum cinerariifolium TaxID=118510 RepID=A0A699HLP6_TANCI|nr:flavonol 4'-sulfotransferase [Tanacetum cinerariifolium]
MSGLIDMWTSEANKMRTNKGQEQGKGSSLYELEVANNVKNCYSVWSKALLKRINSQPFTPYSEASISMLVDCGPYEPCEDACRVLRVSFFKRRRECRKAKDADRENYFTGEMKEKIDKLISQKMSGTGLILT